jgi:Flp pilus assembly protein TadD
MSNPDKMYDEAHALKEAGDLEGAVAKLKEILAIDANHSLTHSALAVHLQRLGKPEEAMVHAKKVVELDPNDPFAYQQLSVISQRCGLIQEAEDAMEKGHQVKSNPGGG